MTPHSHNVTAIQNCFLTLLRFSRVFSDPGGHKLFLISKHLQGSKNDPKHHEQGISSYRRKEQDNLIKGKHFGFMKTLTLDRSILDGNYAHLMHK